MYQQNLFVAFRVNMLQQLHLPVNSTSGKHEETPSKTFEPIEYSQKQHQLNFKLKRELDCCLELISVMWK